MSDTYIDFVTRLEDAFPEIDSDIVMSLRESNEEYAVIYEKISDIKKQFPVIAKIMEGTGEIHMTAEEHAAFIQCYHLLQKLDDMLCVLIHFEIHVSSLRINCEICYLILILDGAVCISRQILLAVPSPHKAICCTFTQLCTRHIFLA